MTVITFAQKLASRTIFDRQEGAVSVRQMRTPIRRRTLFSGAATRAFHAARVIPPCIAIIGCFGILVIGVQSVRLMFVIRNLQETLGALEQEREALHLSLSELGRPEVLAEYAGMLQLEGVESVRYVTVEKGIFAQEALTSIRP